MPHPKRLISLASILTVVVLTWTFRSLLFGTNNQIVASNWPPNTMYHGKSRKIHHIQAPFVRGTVKAYGEKYSKMLVIPRTKGESVDWIGEDFGHDPFIESTVYIVDDPEAENRPPRNKGHEVMVYISYIIDNYYNLSDISIFMHSHQRAWHNNDLLDNDAVQMISRLSSERVVREGYMNLRCHWNPGCPAWMHPGTVEEDLNKQEEVLLARSWSEIFPLDPMPNILAQPCCAQFAISRERIQTLPLAKYVFYRDWLLKTKLPDFISGRIWEYIWQFVFTGYNVVCPKEHVCYCDGYGVCFGGEEQYQEWYKKDDERKVLEDQLRDYNEQREQVKNFLEEGNIVEAEKTEIPEPEKLNEIKNKIGELQIWCDERKEEAKRHGDVATSRAKEAGREWKAGDGF